MGFPWPTLRGLESSLAYNTNSEASLNYITHSGRLPGLLDKVWDFFGLQHIVWHLPGLYHTFCRPLLLAQHSMGVFLVYSTQTGALTGLHYTCEASHVHTF